MSGQHVGGLSDTLKGDEATELARAQAEALRKLTKPVERKREARHDIGDGDPCPEGHGKMLVYGKRQYCPHAAHSGGVRGDPAPTQCWFPLYMKEAARG